VAHNRRAWGQATWTLQGNVTAGIMAAIAVADRSASA